MFFSSLDYVSMEVNILAVGGQRYEFITNETLSL